jgi:hypothetical protein
MMYNDDRIALQYFWNILSPMTKTKVLKNLSLKYIYNVNTYTNMVKTDVLINKSYIDNNKYSVDLTIVMLQENR